MKTTTIKMLALTVSLLTTTTAVAEDDKDTTVVVPATGHLAIKPSRNITGPSNVIISCFYGSSNATSKGLRFTNVTLGDDVVIPIQGSGTTGYILTAQPGEHTLTLTDRDATKNYFNSVSAYWQWEPGTLTKTDTRIYKFINTEERIGFERDEKYADNGYMSCDFAEGEHLYFSIGTGPNNKVLERIGATLGVGKDEVAFIPWSKENWACPEVSDITGISNITGTQPTDDKCYDLQGRRINGRPAKGLYITNGKKYMAQ